MNVQIFDRIKQFTSKQAGIVEGKITENLSLENDLGIYGDDAVEFIIAFGKEFNVDVSNFMAADYFSAEGDPVLPAIIRFITNKKKRKLKDLRLIHLKKAVKAGRLDEDVINS
jgi:acyl carrier protein